MNSEPPLISVIVPVYNCDRYLGEAIESILAQTYRPLEVLVIDDGSTDNSAEIAKKFIPHIQYCYKSHSGIAATLNHGIKLSQGDFLAFIDADDLWVNDTKLVSQMNALQKDPNLDLVFGYVQQFISPELAGEVTKNIKIDQESRPAYFKGTLLLKKETFFQVGYFNSDWHLGEFIDWYIRAKELGLEDIVIPEIYLKRRIHTTNIGIKQKQHRNDYVHIIKQSLERKRSKF